MKASRANKGQFSVIAALLVSVILVTAVISTYTMVRHAPIQDSPKVLTAIGEMNSDIKQVLDFTVGYYGSILKVTGNSAYAKNLTDVYLSGAIVNIARSHPEWNPSFDLSSSNFSTSWFMPESFSVGNLSVTYSLESLGIQGVKYETSSALEVTMLPSDPGVARISVTRDNAEPELGLTTSNFRFYNFTEDSTWELINPTNIIINSNGVYNITLPSGISSDAYSVQVEDNRGLMVSAFYSPSSVASESKIPNYTYTFDWESNEMLDIYKSLNTDTFAIELLQNGTLNWLGQPLELTPCERPIPPVAVKAFRVNATINGVTQQVPFQVEDWASDYMVPLGLSNADSIFSSTNMLVFLVNNDVEKITVWWDGNDTAIQTSYAQENNFGGDVSDTYDITLSNGNISINVKIEGTRLSVTSTGESASNTAEFLRINDERPVFHAGTSCVIYNGSVRTVLQQEPEFSGGGAIDLYSQLVLTLPANTTYYTYTSRMIFVNTTQIRNIADLSVIQLSDLVGDPMTENGTIAIYPHPSNFTTAFRKWVPNGWDHHWNQFISENAGGGIMFTNATNEKLYAFDTGIPIGAVVVDDIPENVTEVNPIELDDISFSTARDLVWYGAVVTFSEEPIYRFGDDVGLWVMVEHPPVVVLDGYEIAPASNINYVDSSLSDMDESADKGTHSVFVAQKYGPDLIHDTMTEAVSSEPIILTLIDSESFEGSWPPSGWSETGNWAKEPDQHYGAGGFSADFDGYGGGVSGILETGELNCSDAVSISVTFGFYDDALDPNELLLEYFDGSNWVLIEDLGTGYTERDWHLYEAEITDPRYFVSDFKIRWRANDVESGEHAYIDLVTVSKHTTPPANYELDLEVQWTHADYDETNEFLCIYLNSSSGENLLVEVWNETSSSWDSLTTLAVGWNNVTVSSHLLSSTFTIRFIGETETGDSTQDYWTVDATLIKCWS